MGHDFQAAEQAVGCPCDGLQRYLAEFRQGAAGAVQGPDCALPGCQDGRCTLQRADVFDMGVGVDFRGGPDRDEIGVSIDGVVIFSRSSISARIRAITSLESSSSMAVHDSHLA